MFQSFFHLFKKVEEKSISGLFVYLLVAVLIAFSIWAGSKEFYFVAVLPIVFCILLALFFKTEKTILLLSASVPLSINIEKVVGDAALSVPTEPIIIVFFMLLLFLVFIKKKVPKNVVVHPMSLIMLAFLIWPWISTVFSSMPMVSLKYAISRTFYLTLFYFFFVYLFQKDGNIHFFLKSLVVFTLILILYTISKHAADGFIRSASYGIMWPFFPDHGMYAAAIAFCVPALFIYMLYPKMFGFKYSWLPVIIVLFVVMMFGIVVSYTRATWLSLIAAFGLFVLLYFKIKFKYILIGISSLAVYAFVNQDQLLYNLEGNKQGSSDELQGHVKSVGNISTDPSNLERINRWSCAMRMVKERPVFGFGPGTYSFQYGAFQKSNETTIISTFTGDLGDAHSEYFSSLSEMGIPGLLFWSLLVLGSMGLAFNIYYKSDLYPAVKLTALMSILGLSTYYVHAFLNNYLQHDKIAIPLFSFIAILVALDLRIAKEMKNQSK